MPKLKLLQTVATLILGSGLLWVILLISILWQSLLTYDDITSILLAADQKSQAGLERQQHIIQALPTVQWLDKNIQGILPRYFNHSAHIILYSAKHGYNTLVSTISPLTHYDEATRLASDQQAMHTGYLVFDIAKRLAHRVYDRLLILLSSLPLLILFVLTGWVDGHLQWHIRRIGIARESSDRFHRWRTYRYGVLHILILSILYWPLDWPYTGMILTLSISLAISIQLSTYHFKKYG
jgi:hypothetical protein